MTSRRMIIEDTVTDRVVVLVGPAPGAPGKSAYEIAVDNGFSGTEQDWLDSLKGETGDMDGFIPRAEIFTETSPVGPRYSYSVPAVSAGDANVAEVRVNGQLVSWSNEWGALRGRNPYSAWADALARAVIEDGDTGSGNAFEIIDRRSNAPADPAHRVWGRRWSDGSLVRNGNVMADVWVRADANVPVPATLPVGTIVVTLGE